MATSPTLASFVYDQVLGGGFALPARMTVLPLADGGLALVSPIPMDDTIVRAIEAMGEVRFLVAPSLMHHLYLPAAAERWPFAKVVAPPGLATKNPAVEVHATLDAPPPELTAAVDVLRIEGAPKLDEFVFHHRAARTLVVTDLVFNMLRPRGFITNLVLWLVGCRGRLAQSRVWRFFVVKDRALAARSMARVLALPFERLVVAHGEVVEHDARARLVTALRWIVPDPPALPSAEGAEEA